MDKIVHLDLKGAPLKIRFLEKVIIAVKAWGGTGILLEWEDTFPYHGELVDIGSQGIGSGDNLYSIDEVRYLLQFIKTNGLKAIQLIQTIGHMEYVLKHPKFLELREQAMSPAVLCPSKLSSQRLVQMMLDQALDVQFDAEYIHIGADEVWHLGVCPECQKIASNSKNKNCDLYLKHITQIALHLKQKLPHLKILIWDDMFRNMGVETLQEYKLGELVQPVVWNYNVIEHFNIDINLWRIYKEVFRNIWAGSAFKGANGSCKIVSPPVRYVSNHEAWLGEFCKNPDIKFSGVILTGWSRYDHYATLCELLPVSMVSLAYCLKTISRCEAGSIYNEASVLHPLTEWPFDDMNRTVQTFSNIRDESLTFLRGDAVATWMNPWQLSRSYTNPLHIESIVKSARQIQEALQALSPLLEQHLSTITGRRSTEEWIGTFVTPILNEIISSRNNAERRLLDNAGIKPS